jgi:hypothetical protein
MQNETNTSLLWNKTVYDASEWVETPLTIFLYFVEILLYLSSNIGCIIFSILLITKRVFHQNLAIILGNVVLSFTLVSISRYYDIIQTVAVYFVPETTKLDYFLLCWLMNTFYNIGIFNACLRQIILVGERAIATTCVKTYEKSRIPFFGIFSLIVQVRNTSLFFLSLPQWCWCQT